MTKSEFIKAPIMAFGALLLAAALPCQADQGKAADALYAVLARENLEILHAKALADGSVEILFGVTVNDADHLRVVETLRAHPDVKGVHAMSSPRTFCRIE